MKQNPISAGSRTRPLCSPSVPSVWFMAILGPARLYAIRECFHGHHAIALTQGNIFGVMSLVFWSLTIVVSIKYVIFILLADNHGEGGIFALLGLISAGGRNVSPRLRAGLVLAGILGAGLLYGDGIITPAISVLSAIEGLEVATKAATPIVLPLTCVVLFLLFLFTALGNRRHREDFRPGHDALVCIDRRSGAWPDFSGTPDLTRHSPGLCLQILCRQ